MSSGSTPPPALLSVLLYIDDSVLHCYILLSKEVYENEIDKLLYLVRCFTRK